MVEDKFADASKMKRTGSWEARNFLVHDIDVRDLKFLAGVWGFVLGVLGYVLIFKP